MKKINCTLLIDDYEPNNVFNKYIIGDADFCNHVKTAIDADKAIAYLLKSAEPGQSDTYPVPELIFLDINMPRLNGFEFMDEYQKLDRKFRSKIKIIMLTTSVNPEDYHRAMEYKEISRFENKPLTREMITDTIDKLL